MWLLIFIVRSIEKDLSGKKALEFGSGEEQRHLAMPPKNRLLEGGRTQALLRVTGKLVKEGGLGRR